MSRLIVKNLPNGITEKRLRSVFEEKGTITDVNLKYAANGVFRKFAFVGFQREEDAQTAENYFHNTFIDTSRIQVEKCRHLSDGDQPRAWSQHSADSSRYSKAHPEKKPKVPSDEKNKKASKDSEDKFAQLLRNPLLTDKEKEAIESLRNDPHFLEFFSINQRGKDASNKASWSNDDATADFKVKKGSQTATKTQKNTEETAEPKEDFNKMKNSVKIKHLPKGVNKAIIREFFVGVSVQRVHLPKKAKDIAFVQFTSKQDVIKAKEFNKKQLLGQSVTVIQCEDPAEDESEVLSSSEAKTEPENTTEVDDSSIAEHGRLFVRNLPFFCTLEDIESLFQKYGPVSDVKLPTDFITKQGKGYAIVTFMMPEHAVKALSLDGKDFQGRTIHVIPAKPKPEEVSTPREQNNGLESSFKKDKSKKTKDNSALAIHSWNSLFLGVNAVMDIMAQRYKVSKNDILESNAGGKSAAVKVALGETQIVKETKEFLEENGVKLEAFNATKGPRSRTVILVKNLPAGTPSSEVLKLFQSFGTINRILLPPAGVTAIVEMLDISEAKKAFRSLVYYKFGSVPLFLEWAPVDALSEAKPSSTVKSSIIKPSEETSESNMTVEAQPKVTEEIEEETVEEDALSDSVGSTLFVKNLNFSTTDEALNNLFSSIGKIKSASVARKLGPNGASLSMGYGFVEFGKAEDAKKAIKSLQRCSLDGHSLELKISERVVNQASEAKRKSTKDNKQSSKIMVRNIPFQASEKEIRDIFSVFGSLKSVRLPSKMGESGSHRGFCFVEYHTKADAKKAFEALSQSTHLYSRRLVLEWAENESQDVEELRQKVGQHFHEDGGTRKKLKRRHLQDELDKNTTSDNGMSLE